uniref:Major facilitator superfamily (MFS) profile domain-containing protein n=1 Tax=Solanum lycopersicum TaxID=4081 RepID=A0A3Q7J0V2_SOLLC
MKLIPTISFCIFLITKLRGRTYYHVDDSSNPGSLPPYVSAAISVSPFVVPIAGQLLFEWIGDKIGRKEVYGITLIIMSCCSIATDLSFGRDPKTIMDTLFFFRFWLGFGIGGNYPHSATIMSEYANKNPMGAFIAVVFAIQGFGILIGGIFAIIISVAWRIILMAGSFPALLTYYRRMKMPKTARYTALVSKNVKQAIAGMEDSQNLFQKYIFSAIGRIPAAKTMNVIEEVALAQTLTAFCSTMLGYWFTVFLIDRIGRFTIQLISFTMMIVFMFSLAIPYHHWTLPSHLIWFVVIYSLTFFFINFGPNATTFVVPAEIFPARLRSTCHGILTACGKLGVMLSAFRFLCSAQRQDKTKADAGYPA